MIDMTGPDKFINSLFDSNMPHLERVCNDVSATLASVAIQYMETNDDACKVTYAALKARRTTVRSMCVVMLNDSGTNALIRSKIFNLFPDLKPTQPPAPVVKPPEESVKS